MLQWVYYPFSFCSHESTEQFFYIDPQQKATKV